MLNFNAENPNSRVLMQRVCWALTPGLGVLIWQFGPGILVNLIFASMVAFVSEAILLYLRNVPIKPFLSDHSALISAWLIAAALPPCVPAWVILVAVTTAIVVAKQLYGGLGNNIFNPAMVGYALAMIAFPLELTDWQVPLYVNFFDVQTCWQCLAGQADVVMIQSGATPLTAWRFGFETIATNEWLWLYPNIFFLLGGVWLLYKRVIQWYIPVAFLVALGGAASVLFVLLPQYPTPLFHWLNGSTMLGTFFISTDPVTAPKSKAAMLIFGAGVGLLVLLFRSMSSTIDGLAFAVLLMNMLTPLLNRGWTAPCKNTR